MKRKVAFTILELLVVVAIIGVLAAFLVPAVLAARKRAVLVQCQTNQITLYRAFWTFALDHNDYLPGNYYTRNETEVWKTDWLSGPGPLRDTGPSPDPATIAAAFAATPDNGTLFAYLGRQPLVLRCPGLPVGPFGQGQGSNGKFDYSAVGIFAGAKIDHLPSQARFKNPHAADYENHPPPLILQEDPANHINTQYIEGCHGHIDKFSSLHEPGRFYAACDGSIQSFSPSPDATFWNWELLTPSGAWWCQFTDFQNKKYGLVWGEWNQK